MPPKPKAVRYNQHTYALFRNYVPRLPVPEVNLYGFLKSIGLEHEHSKFKSFKQLVQIRFTPSSTNGKVPHSRIRVEHFVCSALGFVF